jgi:hypothetical protein
MFTIKLEEIKIYSSNWKKYDHSPRIHEVQTNIPSVP